MSITSIELNKRIIVVVLMCTVKNEVCKAHFVFYSIMMVIIVTWLIKNLSYES